MKPHKSDPFNVRSLRENRQLRYWMNKLKGTLDYEVTTDQARKPQLHERANKQGGCLMRIKFKEWEKISRKGYAMMEIRGTKVGGDQAGDEWKHSIFSSAKDMAGVVKDASAGDILNVTMKKNGNYWNATKIENETANGTVPAGIRDSAGKASTVPVLGAATGSGHICGAEDLKIKNASLAVDFYKAARETGVKKASDITEAFIEVLKMSELVDDWKDGKGIFAINADQDLPTADDLPDLDDE